MGELYEPFPKLPKNIRQIGERDKVLKLYLEDYVNTYLKRLQPLKGSDLRVGLLLGSREMREDVPFVFVDGALEMDSVTQEGEKVAFTEDAWKKAYQEVEQMFPKRTVQGWFLCGSPGCSLSPLNYWRQHSQYFTGKNQLMYLNAGLEGEEAVYITSSDGFYKLRGYSVYYERNQMMQDYMIQQKDRGRAEDGVDDKAIQDFRRKMDERRYEITRHRNTVGLLSGLCSVLAITVLAGGVAMFNNYKKMHEMESVIASVVPAGSVREGIAAVGDKLLGADEKGDAGSAGYVIEEAAADVYPTESPDQVTPETMVPESQWEEAKAGDGESSSGKAAEAGRTAEAESPAAGQEEPSDSQPVSAANYQVYVVNPGETLYGICFKLYQNLGHLDEICRVNGLTDQNSIYAGQELLVP
ncbi:MAG TPA: LysM peptidoglycan-binding domain-containing protein [Candidatus Enterocloster excrementipullorum]|uniref:LysM peptidoglycan-binding domain-containing protein n=1 Tax=Candidatus Enterocloster excrementipullorum TaxID=2838559 RepID=A0A9D2N3A9_9FIRM|nr:LysM peptidoglycan-binding domain-containing protein [Candidatus Enterocloster excrementipullorum]